MFNHKLTDISADVLKIIIENELKPALARAIENLNFSKEIAVEAVLGAVGRAGYHPAAIIPHETTVQYWEGIIAKHEVALAIVQGRAVIQAESAGSLMVSYLEFEALRRAAEKAYNVFAFTDADEGDPEYDAAAAIYRIYNRVTFQLNRLMSPALRQEAVAANRRVMAIEAVKKHMESNPQ